MGPLAAVTAIPLGVQGNPMHVHVLSIVPFTSHWNHILWFTLSSYNGNFNSCVGRCIYTEEGFTEASSVHESFLAFSVQGVIHVSLAMTCLTHSCVVNGHRVIIMLTAVCNIMYMHVGSWLKYTSSIDAQ